MAWIPGPAVDLVRSRDPERTVVDLSLAVALRCLACGWVILLAAIALNLGAHALGLTTWYGLILSAAARGTAPLSLPELAFLLVVYPGVLGLVAWAAFRLLF